MECRKSVPQRHTRERESAPVEAPAALRYYRDVSLTICLIENGPT
jgi:hypothetical protein